MYIHRDGHQVISCKGARESGLKKKLISMNKIRIP